MLAALEAEAVRRGLTEFSLRGEADLPEIWAEPLPVVVDALRRYATAAELGEHLPDVRSGRHLAERETRLV
jgi:hypothetical protein